MNMNIFNFRFAIINATFFSCASILAMVEEPRRDSLPIPIPQSRKMRRLVHKPEPCVIPLRQESMQQPQIFLNDKDQCLPNCSSSAPCQEGPSSQRLPTFPFLKSNDWELSVDQVKECLKFIQDKRQYFCHEYYYLMLLTMEFAYFANRFAQNYLPVAKYHGPENYVVALQAETDEGHNLRLEFAKLAQIFEGYIKNKNWDQYQNNFAVYFAHERFHVRLEDRENREQMNYY